MKLNVIAAVCGSLLLILSSFKFVVIDAQQTVYDITKYGAVADGKTDVAPMVLQAWGAACNSTTPGKVLIPAGTYACGVVELKGPCQSPMEVEIDGTLLAPAQLPGDFWFSIRYVDNVHVFGTGTLDGQGPLAWRKIKGPIINVRIDFTSNGLIEGITSKDSKNFHFNVFNVKNYTFSNINITAPRDSPNTDGIHIGKSSNIQVLDTTIGTGDDCVSIGDGVSQITIKNVFCGPGHGISVGSLGLYENEEPVTGIFVQNCTLSNSDNGVRVKSWPNKYTCEASDIHFEDIILDNVNNPIIIDQTYCPGNSCGPNKQNSKVRISNVSFKNVKGTARNVEVLFLVCSQLNPCDNIQLTDIDITYPSGTAKSRCANIKPVVSGTVNPAACVLN